MSDHYQNENKVNIRHFCSETDKNEVSNIWVSGLDQTVNSKWWPTRPIWKFFFNRMAEYAVEESGDVGPNGQNLSNHWCDDTGNRCMLVAEMTLECENTLNSRIVGCIAVVRGTNSNNNIKVENTETTFSVWKMSVSEEYRRMGIGKKLLDAGEKWAKNNGCKNMRMITANPIASTFYQNQGYELLPTNMFGIWLGGWHEKEL